MIAQIRRYFNNLTIFDNEKKNYLKIVATAWVVYCLVYSFMIFQFCWSNHDWQFLKDRVYLSDGFFEARYSQHLFSVLFFDGQLLPVTAYLFSFLGLAVFSLLLVKYLGFLQKKEYFYFALFIGMNPHIFVLFSYVFIMMPLVWWEVFGILLLFLVEPPFKISKFIGAILCGLLVLGGYPPVIGLLGPVFMTKQLLGFLHQEKSIKKIVYEGSVFCLVFGFIFVLYKRILIPYFLGNSFNKLMYNTEMLSLSEMLVRFFYDSWKSVGQLWQKYPFLEDGYWQFLLLFVIWAVYLVLYRAKNKWNALFLLVGLFLTSRIAFVVASNADFAAFRLTYWGKLGLYIFALSVVFYDKAFFVKNIAFVMLVFCLFLFARIDFEIQKVWNFGFKAERLWHMRLAERITQNSDFNLDEQYVFLSFGTPYYKSRFYSGKTHLDDNEMLNILSLPADLGGNLFWEEKKSPVVLRFGVWGNRLWRVNNSERENVLEKFEMSDDMISKMRQWAYFSSGKYPAINSIYMDKPYILLVLDEIFFNKNKELFLNHFGEMMNGR